MCAARSAASSPAPSMKEDLRRRMNGSPMTYMPGASTTPPVVTQSSLVIEHRHVQPGIIRTKARRPDHRLDAGGVQIELSRPPGRNVRRRMSDWRAEAVAHALCVDPGVDALDQPVHLQVGERATVGQRARKFHPSAVDSDQLADELDPRGARHVEVDRCALGRSDELQGWEATCAVEIVDLVVADVHHASDVHPPLDVTASIDPRQTYVLADAEDHCAARSAYLAERAARRLRRLRRS